jgi:hypothetical protein
MASEMIGIFDSEEFTLQDVIDYFTKPAFGKDHVKPRLAFVEAVQEEYFRKVETEVKESIVNREDANMEEDVLDYIYIAGIDNFEKVTVPYTGHEIMVTWEKKEELEKRLGFSMYDKKQDKFRKQVTRELSNAASQGYGINGTPMQDSKLFKRLYKLREEQANAYALDPYLEDEEFYRTLSEYKEGWVRPRNSKVHDNVETLIDNLKEKYGYSDRGAKEVAEYVFSRGQKGLESRRRQRPKLDLKVIRGGLVSTVANYANRIAAQHRAAPRYRFNVAQAALPPP